MPGMKQDLVQTLKELQTALAMDYRIVPVDVPGMPVFQAVAYPLAPGVTGLKPRLPSGRGMTLAQAMVSAGAEALELRASLAGANRERLGPMPVVDGLAQVPARDLLTGDTVLVPAQEVYLDFAAVMGEPAYADAGSTGCAAGATRQDATLAALLECLERDALAMWWHGGLPAAALPADLVEMQHPRLSWWLDHRDRPFQLLGLATDTGVPVVVAVSSNAEGTAIAHGAAARTDLAAAALSAVTEMVQTELSLARALAMADDEARQWAGYGSVRTLAQFRMTSAFHPGTWAAMDQQQILIRLSGLGLRALAVDLTLPDDPLPSMRVLVPGLCAMGGRIDTPRFRRLTGLPDGQPVQPHYPEPY